MPVVVISRPLWDRLAALAEARGTPTRDLATRALENYVSDVADALTLRQDILSNSLQFSCDQGGPIHLSSDAIADFKDSIAKNEELLKRLEGR